MMLPQSRTDALARGSGRYLCRKSQANTPVPHRRYTLVSSPAARNSYATPIVTEPRPQGSGADSFGCRVAALFYQPLAPSPAARNSYRTATGRSGTQLFGCGQAALRRGPSASACLTEDSALGSTFDVLRYRGYFGDDKCVSDLRRLLSQTCAGTGKSG